MSNILSKPLVTVYWRKGQPEPTNDGFFSTDALTATTERQETGVYSDLAPSVSITPAINQGITSHTHTEPTAARSITYACLENTGATDPWSLILSFNSTTREQKIRDKIAVTTLGAPLKTFSDGFMALWYGDKGLALYVFIGYSSDPHPTQEITVR